MNIIEKLGIESLTEFYGENYAYYNGNKVKELEHQRNELLEVLIEVTYDQSIILEAINVTLMDDIVAKHIQRIDLIEEATGKPWLKIKELMKDE